MYVRLRLILLFTIMSFRAWTQCFTIHGKVTNAADRQAIAASFFAKTGDGKLLVGKSTANGIFTLQIPCNTSALSIEKQGFRAVVLPVSGDEGTYYFEPVLYPVDVQTNDKPYFQSEQKDIVLNNSGSVKSEKTVMRLFKLIDVQTKSPVTGEICLFYTKNGAKKCFTADAAAKSGEIVFDQEDIIGVVANAAGFQPYNGNLIIDQMDNGRSVYEIALSKAVSILAISVRAEKKIRVEITDKKGNLLPVRMKDSEKGFAALNTGDDYRIRFYTGNDFDEISLTKVNGLTLITRNGQIPKTQPVSKSPSLKPVSTPSAEIVAFNTLPSRVIYFHQSSYDLRPDARQTLDSIGAWLSKHPESTAQVIGFTDNVGDAKRNITLSEFRARVTTRYLVNRGAKESQLHWKGVGWNGAPGPGNKEENIALNRRVEIKFDNDVSAQSKKE